MINVEFVDFDFIIIKCVVNYKTAEIKNVALFYHKQSEKCLKYYDYVFQINHIVWFNEFLNMIEWISHKIYQLKMFKNVLKNNVAKCKKMIIHYKK